MKNSIIISSFALASIALLFIGLSTKTTEETSSDTPLSSEQEFEVKEMLTVTPIEHATAVLTVSDTTIYLDPIGGGVAFSGYAKPAIILITDIHGDHLNISTLEHVVQEDTVIIAPEAVKALLPQSLALQTVVVANGETTEQKGIRIEAIPMYNMPERNDQAHTKGRGNGYVLEKNGARMYIAGDTSLTPEMSALKNIDVALIPVNLPYTMSVEEAVEAVLAFTPAQVFPYHYRTKSGFSDLEKFSSLVKEGNSNIVVELLDWYPSQGQ